MGKAGQVVLSCGGRPGCLGLSAAGGRETGRVGSEGERGRQPAQEFDPQSSPPSKKRQGVRVTGEDGLEARFIPELSKFTLASYRNRTLITGARE